MPRHRSHHAQDRGPQHATGASVAEAAARPRSLPPALFDRRLHMLVVPCLLAITAGLAITSLVGDSVTFDETSDVVAGMSFLKTGDFRLDAVHPPLARIWVALPLLFVQQRWPSPDEAAWEQARHFDFGKLWLFKYNEPERLILLARLMMVVLLLATCLTIYALARVLFGPPAALLALFLAAFSPTLLAHGRLATTDLPVALAAALFLLTFARLLQRMTWPRLLACAAALAALSLIKHSWPIVLIGPAVMIAITLLRTAPLECALFRRPLGGPAAVASLRRRSARARAIGLSCLVLVATTWAGIWTCYGWRFAIVPEASAAASPETGASDRAISNTYAEAWRTMLAEPGGPLKRAWFALSDWAWRWHLLPQGYLYGFNYTLHSTEVRESYLMGDYSKTGHAAYFPLVFALKTPIPIMLLLAAGIAALICKPDLRRRNPILLCGVLAFGAVYAAAAVGSKINIGQRHILPLYPLVFVLAGAAVSWLRVQRWRWAIPAAAAWLVGANLWIHPHYLSYFNELIGGPANGHKYFVDSNIDWGQDLKRLARYVQQFPGQPLQLAYFGTAEPAAYGIHCSALPSYWSFDAQPGELTGGLYVLSVTQLLGVYDLRVRDAFWMRPQTRDRYCGLAATVAKPPPDQSPEALEEWQSKRSEFERARRWRLMNQLQHRPPDDRIGYSLFVYKLSQAQVDELTRP